MTESTTLHLKKRKVARSTAQEDFMPQEDPIKEEPRARFNQDLDEVSLLDLFAMMALPGVAKRLEDPTQIAEQCYKIGMQMRHAHREYKDCD
jgi:hypothetical protein